MTPARPRWKCGVDGCPANRWQVLRTWVGDPVDAAVQVLQRHNQQEHKEHTDR
jgi:hypothetical protein